MKDAPSIMQEERECYLTGRTDQLERHHIFGGSNRKWSAKYGLWVYLTHDMHNEPPNGVHHNLAMRQGLQKEGQKAFERHYPDLNFRAIFGRNYI